MQAEDCYEEKGAKTYPLAPGYWLNDACFLGRVSRRFFASDSCARLMMLCHSVTSESSRRGKPRGAPSAQPSHFACLIHLSQPALLVRKPPSAVSVELRHARRSLNVHAHAALGKDAHADVRFGFKLSFRPIQGLLSFNSLMYTMQPAWREERNASSDHAVCCWCREALDWLQQGLALCCAETDRSETSKRFRFNLLLNIIFREET